MKTRFLSAIAILGLGFTLAACGVPAQDSDTAYNKDASIKWEQIDRYVYRGCDTEKGNLIYLYNSNGMSVVPGGCQKADS